MPEPSATRWAWQQLSRRQLDPAHALTLLAACDHLDQTAQACGRDAYHPDVVAITVTGVPVDVLAPLVGVTARTMTLYCRVLAKAGLMTEQSPTRFALAHHGWAAAADFT